MSSTQLHTMANLQHVKYPSGRTFGPIIGQHRSNMVGYWSNMVGFGPIWSDLVQYGRILVQYGRILVQDGRIWSHMVEFGPRWSDLVPKVVKQNLNK